MYCQERKFLDIHLNRICWPTEQGLPKTCKYRVGITSNFITMKNFILPAVLILIGTGTAFATQKEKSSKEKLAVRQGYIFNSLTNQWDRSVMCQEEDAPICTVDGTVNGAQVFGTSGPQVDHPETANVELYKIN